MYVDRYSRAETAALLWLLFASAADLGLTLHHVALGGGEANPVMDWFLVRFGAAGFAAAKLGLTVVPGLFLLIHARFRGSYRALWMLGVMYAAVLGSHVVAALDR